MTDIRLWFFEEWPEEANNLRLLDGLTRPVSLMLAAPDVGSYRRLAAAARARSSQVRGLGWWPVLTREEGYWLSPFADPTAVERIVAQAAELGSEHGDEALLLDLELPLPRRRWVRPSPRAWRAVKRLAQVARERGLRPVTAEYGVLAAQPILARLGLAMDPERHGVEKCLMCYSSFPRYVARKAGRGPAGTLRRLSRLAGRLRERYGNAAHVGLGCTAAGIGPAGRPLNAEELAEEIGLLRAAGHREAWIFRAGGHGPAEMAELWRRLDGQDGGGRG